MRKSIRVAGLLILVGCGRSGPTAEETVAYITTGAEDAGSAGGPHPEDRYTRTSTSPAIYEFRNPRRDQQIMYKVEKISNCSFRTQYLVVLDGSEYVNNRLELDFSSARAVTLNGFTAVITGLKKRCMPEPCSGAFSANEIPSSEHEDQERAIRALAYLHEEFCPLAPF